MKLGVLFSGGKDSCYALHKATQKEEVVCLISIISENAESYMFHTPNIGLTKLQAEAIGLPLIQKKTKGEKEKELKELKSAIKEAKELYRIEGIVTGAVESVYQATRIQKICAELGLKCFNPLWQREQLELVREISSVFDVMISGVFAYPLTKSWLGEKINDELIGKLQVLQERYQVSPTGEGGEIETTVLDAPFFRNRIEITDSEKKFDGYSGTIEVKDAKLVRKVKKVYGEIPEKKLDGNTLIIDSCDRKDSLSKDEFVLPIAKAVGYDCFVRHFSEVGEKDLKKCKRVIISGSPFGDFESTKHLEKFKWLKTFEKPVLGICAGHQVIGLVFGSEIKNGKIIGMKNIKAAKKNELIPKDIEGYCMHSQIITKPEGFDIIAKSGNFIEAIKHKKRPIFGVQFHPEVRNHAIIQRFLRISVM
ncbi:MAG: TIGR00289 family protein [Candidatus Aenigmarchaeota archaeon]|nr:TIGR00289 family protein [Candidatus Aenigmarchaeota archaeon]